MDAPIKDLERMEALQRQGRELLDAGRLDEALAATEAALELEVQNLRSLALKADVLERLGKAKEVLQLRAVIKHLKREAWQREVEAEIRGHHDLMGEAIRHEQL
jgi:tetratricopeptide (TPR) repeat protein